MKSNFHTAVLVIVASLALAQNAASHGGGLNGQGCHTDSKTGNYHCHRAPGAAPQSSLAAPSKSRATNPQPGIGAYPNCTAARAAGAAPIRRGEPGYGPHLDRDNDGIGCEVY